MNNDTTGSSAAAKFTIRLSNGTRFPLTVASSADPTVLQVKQAIVEHYNNTSTSSNEQSHEFPVPRQRIVHKGRILDDARLVSSYEIATDGQATLFLVKGSVPTTTTAADTSQPFTTTATASPATAGAFAAGNPWGITPGGQAAAAAGGAMPSSPQEMEQMMNEMNNNPLMQSLLNNPDMMQSMMQMQMQTNPQLRQMLEEHPHLRHVLEDPQVMRQAMEQMRNPSTRQQALRNQDLALSQLENMPGGFAALSSMYRNVQEPLEQAMEGASSSPSESTASPSNSNNSNAGANGTAMPNPWGSPTANTTRSTPSAATTTPSMPGGMDPNMLANLMSSMGSGGGATNNNNISNPWGGAPAGSGAATPTNNGAMGNPWGMMGAAGGNTNMPDPQAMLSMLENPAMQQMMRQAMDQNPGMFRQMMAAQNPMMAQLMEQSGPEFMDQMMRQALDPNVMRAALQMQQQQQQQQGGNNDMFGGMMMPPPPQAGSGASGMDFSSLLQGGLGGAGAVNPWATGGGAAAPATNVAPADRYRSQLRSLYDMGFDNEQQCLAVLESTGGNLNRAVDQLLTSPPAPAAATSELTHPSLTTAAEGSTPSEDDIGNNDNNATKGETEKKND